MPGTLVGKGHTKKRCPIIKGFRIEARQKSDEIHPMGWSEKQLQEKGLKIPWGESGRG